MKSSITSHQALYTLFTSACKPLMENKKFLTNKEFKEKQGHFAQISGPLHKIERDLKELQKLTK